MAHFVPRETAGSIALSVEKACELCSVGRTKFYELLKNKTIPARKIGRRTVVLRSELKRHPNPFRVRGGRHEHKKTAKPRPRRSGRARCRPSGRARAGSQRGIGRSLLDPVDPAKRCGVSRAKFDAGALRDQKYGTEGVRLFAEQGVRMDLPAGKVHATYAAGHITVENRSDKPVLIQFEFLPICKSRQWPQSWPRSNKAWRGSSIELPVSILKPVSGGGSAFCVPVPRQQVADPFCRVIQHPCQDIGEPGLRIDVVELGGGDERVEGRCPPAAFVGAGEGPVAAPDRDGTQLALGGVVGHAQAAVVEEAGQRGPALEAVVDGLAGVAVLGDPGALLAQPGLQRDDERPAALGAHVHALRRRQAVNLALDSEQRIDARNRLAGDRRLVDPGQIEELAPGMGPTGGLDDWPCPCGWPRRGG